MNNVDISTIGRVGVLFGGVSAEREVSLESGNAVLTALKASGIEAVAIEIDNNNANNIVQQITAANIDIAFIALHGGIGEDGRLQAVLDIMGIPYTGSDTQAAALAMNKLITKQVWQGIGLPTSPFVVLNDQTNFQQVMSEFGAGVMVKPAHEGSSIGMTMAYTEQELLVAYGHAKKYDTAVIAEKLLPGEEYTVAILNGKALPAIKLETDHSFYDYEAKYIDNTTKYLCPCGLSDEKEKELQQLSLDAFNSLHCRGWGRVDVMVDDNNAFQLLEVNTVPGMTSHSLVPMSAKAAGYSFEALVIEILQEAKRRV